MEAILNNTFKTIEDVADVREMKENQPVKMFVKQYAKLFVKTLEKR